jgi:hypothetical protein
MPRRTQFTVDAESVQGNAGATITFSCITIGERKAYLSDPDLDNIDMIRLHTLSWSGIVDNDGNELPDPKDEPDAIDALFMVEMRAINRLMWQGPDGDSAKN